MSRITFVVALMALGCSAEPGDEGALFDESDVGGSGGTAFALAGPGGAPLNYGGSDVPHSAGSAGETPAVSTAGSSSAGAGGSNGAQAGGGTTTAGQPQGGGGTGGITMAGSGGLAGTGGASEPTDVLLLELEAIDDVYQSQYNYSLDPTATFTFSLAGFVEGEANPDFVCHVQSNEPVANRYTGTTTLVMPSTADHCLGTDSTRVSFHFRLNASLDGGGSFRVRSDEATLPLFAYDVTRWEREVTSNDWVTVSTSPNVYRWETGVKVRVYGRLK
jgi:hypothetical protein